MTRMIGAVACAGVLTIGTVLVGCAGDSVDPNTRDAQASTTAPAAPQAILFDYRPGLPTPENTASETVVAAVYGSPAPDNVQVSSPVTGAFIEAGAKERLHLLTRGPTIGAPQNSTRSMLALFTGDRLITQFVPPDHTYFHIAAVTDVDGDGIDEIALVAQTYQMGQLSARADVLSLAGGARKLLGTLGIVYENSCDAPFANGDVRAAALRRASDGVLTKETYVAGCPTGGADVAIDAFELKDASAVSIAQRP